MQKLGIDLGTTNTAAAADGRPLAVGDADQQVLPSVVAFLPNGSVQVGATARRRRTIDGPNVIFSSKRLMGRTFEDAATREFRERYPLELLKTASGGVAFRTRAGAFSPTDVAAMLLSRIRQRIGRAGETSVVVTHPCGAGEAQRSATLTAARRAGFPDAELLDEPTATLRAYVRRGTELGRTAVYDFGGGTFQISLLDCSRGAPQLLAQATDPFLGGDDVDQEIARWVTTEVTKQANWDLANFAGVRVRLVAEAERVKIALDTQEEILFDLSQVDPECPLAGEGLRLSRQVFERLATPLVTRGFLTCDRALRDAGLGPGEIDTVLFAGGSTKLPLVQQAVETYFGRPGLAEIDPTLVVAVGASTPDLA